MSSRVKVEGFSTLGSYGSEYVLSLKSGLEGFTETLLEDEYLAILTYDETKRNVLEEKEEYVKRWLEGGIQNGK